MDAVQFATQLALMSIGGVSSWAVWVTVQHFHLKKDLNEAFTKIRQLEREVQNANRDYSQADTCRYKSDDEADD